MERTRFDSDFEEYCFKRFGVKSQYEIIEIIKHEFLSEHLDISNPNEDQPAIGVKAIKNKMLKIRSENNAFIKYYNSDEFKDYLAKEETT